VRRNTPWSAEAGAAFELNGYQMSDPTHSRIGDVPSSQPSADSSDKMASLKLTSSLHGGWKDSFVRGLTGVFDSLVTRPDFRRHYERNLAVRLHRPWHRVGDSMRLAMGKPVRITVRYPDGQFTTHVVEPNVSDDPYWIEIRQANEAVQDVDENLWADHVTFLVAGEQADRLAAYLGRKREVGSE
jgi:hypothetical protein